MTLIGDTGRIRAEHVATAVRRCRAASRERMTVLVDDLHARQPTLLASVAVQGRFGATPDTIAFLLELLLVCDLAAQAAGVAWPTVTESDQERHLARLAATACWNEALGADADALQSRYVLEHPEPALLAWVIASCNAWLTSTAAANAEREADKYVLLAAMTFVESLARAPDLGPRGS
jgi:hypothetical protein